MYVVLIGADDSVTTTKREKIVQRSKLVNEFWVLTAQEYNGFKMADATLTMEYMLPCSKKYRTETMVLSKELYEDHLRYELPIDTKITSEAGDIELLFTFTMLDVLEDGTVVQRVRKISEYKLTITPLPDWSQVIPDEALSALDQRLIMLNAQMKELGAIADVLNDTKADNVEYDADARELQLTSNGNKIGNALPVDDMLRKGLPVVDFGSGSGSGGSGGSKPDDDSDDVVEF